MFLLLLACKPAQGDFSALIYNIAGLPEGLSSSEPVRFIPQMGEKMNAYDLVLVQEDFAYHDLLTPTITLPFASEPKPRGETPVNDGLNRFSRFAFEPVERTRWEACYGLVDHANDCLAEKGFSVASTMLQDGVDVLVVNLHADAGGGPHDIEARSQNFAQLADVLAADDRAVIVGGDTNLRPTERSGDGPILQSFVERAGLTEVEQVNPEREHIDRFFYRSSDALELTPSGWGVAEEFVSPEGDDLSDHPAIRVDFGWLQR